MRLPYRLIISSVLLLAGLALTPFGHADDVAAPAQAPNQSLDVPAPLNEPAQTPLEARTWQQLAQSHWIQDGDVEAPRVIYTFTDANCPYCRQLWHDARPWVDAGEVQLRHIMVGILAPDSPGKAAAIFGADDPAAALKAHENGQQRIEASAEPRDIEEQVYTNNQLFEALGLYATPTIAFQRETENGTVRIDRIQGLPNDEQLIDIMGSEAP